MCVCVCMRACTIMIIFNCTCIYARVINYYHIKIEAQSNYKLPFNYGLIFHKVSICIS